MSFRNTRSSLRPPVEPKEYSVRVEHADNTAGELFFKLKKEADEFVKKMEEHYKETTSSISQPTPVKETE